MLKDLFSFTINDHSHTYQIKDFYTIFFTKLEIFSETECDEREVYVIYNKEETILYNRGLLCRFAWMQCVLDGFSSKFKAHAQST